VGQQAFQWIAVRLCKTLRWVDVGQHRALQRIEMQFAIRQSPIAGATIRGRVSVYQGGKIIAR